MVRTQLRYFGGDRNISRVLVTSADSGEGKSMLSLNLARAAASSDDRRALLIEADMRRGSLAKMIDSEPVAGLSELLSHSQDLASSLDELVVNPDQTDDEGPRASFDVLVAGATPPNPLELLESRRMTELLELADSRYDLVILDSPPIGVVSDPIALVHQVEGVVVICRLGRSRRDHALRLMKQLRSLNAHILGVVVNGTTVGPGGYYGYYRYGEPSGEKNGRRRRRTRLGAAQDN
jgi:capsular exopolysaccharide synthesis family protein